MGATHSAEKQDHDQTTVRNKCAVFSASRQPFERVDDGEKYYVLENPDAVKAAFEAAAATDDEWKAYRKEYPVEPEVVPVATAAAPDTEEIKKKREAYAKWEAAQPRITFAKWDAAVKAKKAPVAHLNTTGRKNESALEEKAGTAEEKATAAKTAADFKVVFGDEKSNGVTYKQFKQSWAKKYGRDPVEEKKAQDAKDEEEKKKKEADAKHPAAAGADAKHAADPKEEKKEAAPTTGSSSSSSSAPAPSKAADEKTADKAEKGKKGK